ncbi:MarR family transcriptional regulator [Mycobacterium sp. 21AC1]|uniref:MarR family winged helix-turn-helix transcriptional regulator n=1 Tax=[Mycobacterium] appelbergii TaxID=2939269 RepID=UPI002939243F|nr:MarR family transcriptional regulator [Mycobacterium sp. 21AC1]MDV3123478.1 MarR family transcriptional regulator [Mycobacterium sp. 21AC1]
MTPERTIADALGVLVGRAFRVNLYDELTADVAPALTPATYPVISAISRFGPSTASSLADELGLDRSVVSRRAMTLVQAGLLHTTSRPDDKRQVLFELTDTGTECVHTMRLRLDAAVARHISQWTSPERADFASLLARFVEAGALGADPGEGQTSSKRSHPAIS